MSKSARFRVTRRNSHQLSLLFHLGPDQPSEGLGMVHIGCYHSEAFPGNGNLSCQFVFVKIFPHTATQGSGSLLQGQKTLGVGNNLPVSCISCTWVFCSPDHFLRGCGDVRCFQFVKSTPSAFEQYLQFNGQKRRSLDQLI